MRWLLMREGSVKPPGWISGGEIVFASDQYERDRFLEPSLCVLAWREGKKRETRVGLSKKLTYKEYLSNARKSRGDKAMIRVSQKPGRE